MKHLLTTLLLTTALLTTALHAAPLKVYILAGQSNMQGHANISTFGHIGKDPKTAPLLQEMIDKTGKPVTPENTWINSLSEDKNGKPTTKQGPLTAGFGANEQTIGPEFTFGITTQKHHQQPILIIKTAWGGKNLHTDFRPPSASTQPAGKYYQLMLGHIKQVLADPSKTVPNYQPTHGIELAGFVWFQGWNDLVDGGAYPKRDKPGGYDRYTENLAHLIRDIRNDLNSPKLPVVIGVIGVDGPTKLYQSPRYKTVHQNFRDAMAAPAKMPEFKGNVTTVLTEKYWDHQLAAVRDKKNRTPEEEEIAKGSSNLGFHYLGSAKILGQIGKALAEALIEIK